MCSIGFSLFQRLSIFQILSVVLSDFILFWLSHQCADKCVKLNDRIPFLIFINIFFYFLNRDRWPESFHFSLTFPPVTCQDKSLWEVYQSLKFQEPYTFILIYASKTECGVITSRDTWEQMLPPSEMYIKRTFFYASRLHGSVGPLFRSLHGFYSSSVLHIYPLSEIL